jgi:hypothetical protein
MFCGVVWFRVFFLVSCFFFGFVLGIVFIYFFRVGTVDLLYIFGKEKTCFGVLLNTKIERHTKICVSTMKT